jgi:hypothetical protein
MPNITGLLLPLSAFASAQPTRDLAYRQPDPVQLAIHASQASFLGLRSLSNTYWATAISRCGAATNIWRKVSESDKVVVAFWKDARMGVGYLNRRVEP